MITILTLSLIFIRKFLDILIELFTLNISLKLILILVLFCVILFINNYNTEYLYDFPDKYILNTYKDHIFNILIISIYPLVFIVGILYVRFSNMSRSIDLYSYYYDIKLQCMLVSKLHLLLTLILVICIFKLYLMLLRGLIKFVRFEFIKRHLYLSDSLSSNNYTEMISYLRAKTGVRIFSWMGFTQKLFLFLKLKFDGELFGLHLGRLWSRNRYYIPYYILFILLVYDMIFNAYILKNVFTVLPFVFIYALWVKLCKFLDGLQPFYDMYIHYLLYDKLYKLDDRYVQLGPFLLEHSTIRRLYMYYILTDLVHDMESENNEELSPEEILKNKKITWYDIFNMYYNKVKLKIKEVFIDPLK